MNKTAAVLAVVALSTVAAPAAAHARQRPAPAPVTCQAQLVVGADLSVFGSPATAGRNRLGDLVAPETGRISVSMAAGVFTNGAPEDSRAVYKVVPKAGLTYADQWFGGEVALTLTGTAWISGSALRQTARVLSCDGRLPAYAPARPAATS